ncbi:MAG: TolC family protein [Gemmatimonadetes bacterium]|nr:TolC family protein [Gemmatimonadota bacterium]
MIPAFIRTGVRPLRLAAAVLAFSLIGQRAVAAQTQVAPTTLSLEQALALAKENNPAFLQQRNDVDVARSSVRSAYGNLLPTLDASTGYGYTAAGEARFGSVGFGAQPEVYSSSYALSMNMSVDGATLLQPSVQRSQKRATERRVEGAAAGLEAQVSQQYLSVLQARELVAQAEREVARTAEYVRLAEAQLEVGAGTPLNVRTAQVTRGQAEVSLIQARNTADIAALTLGQMIGVALDPSVQLTTRFTIFEPTWQADALVQMALENNPALLAAKASTEAARTSIQAARSSYLPRIGLSVGVRGYVQEAGNLNSLVQQQLQGLGQQFETCNLNNDLRQLVGRTPANCGMFNPSDPSVVDGLRRQMESRNSGFPFSYNRQPLSASLSFSLPVFQGFSRQLQVDQAKASASDAQQQVRGEELRLRQEVNTAVRNLRAAYETARLQEQVRANAAESLRLAQERFRFGAANSIEVTDAQTRLASTEQAQIDAVYVFHKSLAALEALVGQSLR